jgi:hypothetical protein
MSTTGSTNRTRRYTDPSGNQPNATPGAVRNQTGGTLPVYVCNACDTHVVWATSARTGRRYLCDVSYGYHGQAFYIGRNVHRCDNVLAQREAHREAAITEARDEVQRLRSTVEASTQMIAFFDELLADGHMDADQHAAQTDARVQAMTEAEMSLPVAEQRLADLVQRSNF